MVIFNVGTGAQNFLQQEGQASEDDEIAIDGVVSHIRGLSSDWKVILSKSAWAQAIGSLLSTVAKKIILDVEDLSSLGADEAYRVANLISKVVKLDDIFLPDDKNLPQISVASQYAPDWLKLQFLSEVLQSDLKDVKYLWFESELSLYFTAAEVIELIQLSFEDNYRTRDAISEIRKNPHPKEDTEGDW
jgi:centromere/kinetochore protein ZW10